MKLCLSETSRVSVDVRSKGLIAALDHEVTFSGTPALEASALEVPDGAGPFAIDVVARLAVTSLDVPTGTFERDKMLDNLRGRDVLDAAKHPDLVFRGKYEGTLEKGALAGELVVRGAARPVSFAVTVDGTEAGVRAHGVWEGTQTSLGIKPYRALLGALKLADWAKIRIDVSLARVV